MELVKRKLPTRKGARGPTVERPVLVPRRGEPAVRELRQKLLWMADAITRGIFPRDPGAAFESPCGLCDFRRRETLGLGPGSRVVFEVNDRGAIEIRKAGTNNAPKRRRGKDRFARARGRATVKWRTDELMRLLRSDA